MDFFSDNLIFIAFIVIALVSQIGRLLVRNAEKRKQEAEGRPETAAYNTYEYGDAGKDADEDGAFSAWALSIDTDAVASAAAVPVSPTAVSTLPAAPVPGSSPFPVLAPDTAAWEAGPSVGTRNKARSAGFPGKLDYLPPLKRAVILSEILGPPKGV